MNDGSIPTSRLITFGLWCATALVGAAGWVVAVVASQHFGLMLGMTACCLSAMAAVAHVRCMIQSATRYLAAGSFATRDHGEDLLSSGGGHLRPM